MNTPFSPKDSFSSRATCYDILLSRFSTCTGLDMAERVNLLPRYPVLTQGQAQSLWRKRVFVLI